MFIREYDEFVLSEKREGQAGGGIHPFYEILYIDSGEMTLQWLGHTYSANGPSLFLLTPNTPHRLEQNSKHCRGWFVEFDLEETDHFPPFEAIVQWNQLQSELDWTEKGIALVVHTIEGITMTIRSGLERRSPGVFEHAVRCDMRKLMLLIEDYVESIRLQEQRNTARSTLALEKLTSQQQIYSLIRFIENRYTSEITLPMLAELRSVSFVYYPAIQERHGNDPDAIFASIANECRT